MNDIFIYIPLVLIINNRLDLLQLVQAGQVHRLLTPVLLHAGLLHIGFNLFFQSSLGYQYESQWGTRRIIAIYWASGITYLPYSQHSPAHQYGQALAVVCGLLS